MILVLDDEPGLTALLDEELTRLGLAHEISGTVADAFRRISEHGESISVAMCDLRIEGEAEGGLRMAEMTRSLANAAKAEVPIVLMTGGALYEEVESRASALRIAGFLSKPFTPDEFEAAVRHHARFFLERTP